MNNNNQKPSAILFYSLILITSISGCNFFNASDDDDKGEVLARVYDRLLYEEDLKEILPKEPIPSSDSVIIIQNYINVWAKNELMLYKAEYNLNQEQKNFEEQIVNYRNDLLKYAYQDEFLRQNLDTNISKEEIEAYYNEDNDNFLLRENIVKARYMIISPNAPKLEEAKNWFISQKEENREELRNYALKYAREFYNDSTWVGFDKIAAQIPHLSAEEQSSFLTKNNFNELADSNRVSLLKIEDFKLRGEKAPLSYVENLIKNILLNKKKLELLADLEKNLLEDALKKKEFETY